MVCPSNGFCSQVLILFRCSQEYLTFYAPNKEEELNRNFSLPLPFRGALDLPYNTAVSFVYFNVKKNFS